MGDRPSRAVCQKKSLRHVRRDAMYAARVQSVMQLLRFAHLSPIQQNNSADNKYNSNSG